MTSRTVLTPDGSPYPGRPVPTAKQDHQPRVPATAGIPPYCTCGYVGGNRLDRPLLADHLREHDPNYGTASISAGPATTGEWPGRRDRTVRLAVPPRPPAGRSETH